MKDMSRPSQNISLGRSKTGVSPRGGRIVRPFGWMALVLLFGGGVVFAASRATAGPGTPTERPAEMRGDSEEDGPVVTFSGFRPHQDGSSTVRVHMTQRAEVERSQKGTKVEYLLEDATIRFRNNKNPLRAEHFATNLLSAKLDAVKGGAKLTLELRHETPTEHRMSGRDGQTILSIDIPAPPSSNKDEKAAKPAED